MAAALREPAKFWAHVLRHPEQRSRFISIHKQVIDPFVEPVVQILARPGAPGLDPAQVALAAHSMQLGVQLELLTGTGELDDRLHARLFLTALGIEEE